MAEEIRDCCTAIEQAKDAVLDGCDLIRTKTLRVGELLITIKGVLAHGEYVEWIEANCPFSRQMAARYVKLSNVNRDLHLPDGMSTRAAMLLHGIIPNQEHTPGHRSGGGVSPYQPLNAFNLYLDFVGKSQTPELWRQDQTERRAMQQQYRPLKSWLDELYAI